MRVSEPYTIFPRTLKSGKVVYYYQFRSLDGKRSSAKSTGCTTEASAKRFCNKLYNSGDFQQSDLIKFGSFSKSFFIKNNDWFKWKQVNNKSISSETLLAYDKWLRNQLLPYFENYQLQSITRDVIKKWIIWASSKWSAKTVNNAQTVLNVILNSAVDCGYIKYNPATNLGFRRTEKIARNVFTIEELSDMYKSNKWGYETMRTAFLLASITGMRVGEISALKTSDIKGDYILVAKTFSRNFGLGKTTKGKYTRIVPIPKNFPFLEPNKEGYLFCNMKGTKPFDCTTLYDNIIRVGLDVGVDCKERKLSTHTLRDFYNTYLESENVTDAKIKAVIGHKDVSMTGHYTYWKPDMFPEIHEVQNKLITTITGVNYGN